MATRVRKYRGKYPNNIRQIESLSKGVVLITVNSGCRYTLNALDTKGKSPELNQDVFIWPVLLYLPPNNNQQHDDEWYSK